MAHPADPQQQQPPAVQGGWLNFWPFVGTQPPAPQPAVPPGLGGVPDALVVQAQLPQPPPQPPQPPANPDAWYVNAWNSVTNFFSEAWKTVCSWWNSLMNCCKP